MDRRKKLKLNTVVSIAQRVVTILCGFILPRLFLKHFGSEVNGLVSSIAQFLSLITIFDSGMGVIIEASLYKPLADGDQAAISRVMTSGQKFYSKLVILLSVYVLGVALIYPNFVCDRFGFFYTFFLVFAISISHFGQYCIGVTNGLLLSADQKGYINYTASIVTVLLNTGISILLILLNCPVQIVKLASSMVFLSRPIFLALYVKKHYKVNWKEHYETEPIKQKWNGVAQHVAAIVLTDTDVVVLTLFSTLKNVSIYSVYLLVINGIRSLLSATTAGIKPIFGNMIAKEEWKTLNNTFSYVEWGLHTLTTLLFSLVCVLIVPFVKIYTKGVDDANYLLPTFALILSIAYSIYCYRIPYLDIVMAAGKFKETQASAIIEAIINIVVSVVMVFKFGLVGVAIGTLVAMTYRLIYLVFFIRKNILKRNITFFIKNFLVDAAIFSSIYFLSLVVYREVESVGDWIVLAFTYGGIGLGVVLLFNLLFYRANVIKIWKTLLLPIRKKKST